MIVFDVDKIVTNVTIKDAPYELSDIFILQHMRTFVEVVEHSIRRGTIKGTGIETGTRYVQLVNCRKVIPVLTTFGRFKVRLFLDNKTECKVCKDTGHPSFRCPQKEQQQRLCYRCKSPSHITRDCTNDIVCNYCNGQGHKKAECEAFIKSRARDIYGEYAEEILEGQEAESITESLESTKQFEEVRKVINFDSLVCDTTQNTDIINKTDKTIYTRDSSD